MCISCFGLQVLKFMERDAIKDLSLVLPGLCFGDRVGCLAIGNIATYLGVVCMGSKDELAAC